MVLMVYDRSRSHSQTRRTYRCRLIAAVLHLPATSRAESAAVHSGPFWSARSRPSGSRGSVIQDEQLASLILCTTVFARSRGRFIGRNTDSARTRLESAEEGRHVARRQVAAGAQRAARSARPGSQGAVRTRLATRAVIEGYDARQARAWELQTLSRDGMRAERELAVECTRCLREVADDGRLDFWALDWRGRGCPAAWIRDDVDTSCTAILSPWGAWGALGGMANYSIRPGKDCGVKTRAG